MTHKAMKRRKIEKEREEPLKFHQITTRSLTRKEEISMRECFAF
jgi:hypothetical protein